MNAYQKLEHLFEKIAHLKHLQAIAGWDEAVMMPAGGGTARAEALSTLQSIIHELLIDPSNQDLIEQAKELNVTDSWQQANLYWIEKHYRNATCLPTTLVQELTKATILCEQAWRTLRAANNWDEFAPLLERTLNLVKESANIRADVFQRSAYDILLDEYSPGLSQAIIDPLFATLTAQLPDLIHQAMNQQQADPPFIPQGSFSITEQKNIGLELMQAIGFDFNRGRLDVSHHPFCGGVPQDVRITTRYNEHEFMTALMGICHETGHACYEQALPEQWLNQPVGMALGMSVHESQSLLIEMQACRSATFMQFLSPRIIKRFGHDSAYTADNLFKLYTQVQPGLIRVDADELCYPLHVILRYNIEKALIAGSMTVADLPDAWDAAMQQYFNLSTKDNYRDGVMQDVHWSSGAFGYFPAYTIGRLIAAQLYASAIKAYPDIPNKLAQGDFHLLFEWLGHHVHHRASSVPFNTLIQEATQEPLTATHFLNHIQARYFS